MGFVTLPREWEGLHEAFPVLPPQLDTRGILSPSFLPALLGTFGGLAWNLKRAIQRKPLSLAVLSGIGICTIPFAALDIALHETGRRKFRNDIEAILKRENVAMPPRKYVKVTSQTTPETNAIIGGLLAVSGLGLYRRTPNFPRVGIFAALGAFGIGQLIGAQGTAAYYQKLNPQAELKFQLQCLKGSKIFAEQTHKPVDAWLYPILSSMDQPLNEGLGQSGLNPFARFGSNKSPDEIDLSGTGEDEGVTHLGAMVAAMPKPPGYAPHMTIETETGEKITQAQRDFEWNPESAQEGIEELRDHLEDLNKARAKAAQSAEYLWNTIAQREASKYPPYGRKDDLEDVVLERKALELLTSIHKQLYSHITDLDWCIANTKKLMLQMQSDGKWLPNTVNSIVATETREKILNNIRMHRRTLEVQESTIEESLKMMPVTDEDKDDIRRSVSENLVATTKLLEDLEREAEEGT